MLHRHRTAKRVRPRARTERRTPADPKESQAPNHPIAPDSVHPRFLPSVAHRPAISRHLPAVFCSHPEGEPMHTFQWAPSLYSAPTYRLISTIYLPFLCSKLFAPWLHEIPLCPNTSHPLQRPHAASRDPASPWPVEVYGASARLFGSCPSQEPAASPRH